MLAMATVACDAPVTDGTALERILLQGDGLELVQSGALQFEAIGQYSPDTFEPITTVAHWRSSDPEVADFSNARFPGLLIAARPGQTLVTVSYQGQTRTTSIVVREARSREIGPLRRSPTNPRFFARPDGQTVYLSGFHTWTDFQENGAGDPPQRFDYRQFLDFLTAHHQNFTQLWRLEQSRWDLDVDSDNYWVDPTAYLRPGPGLALDGKPKFDLDRFNQAYFDRMRQRVQAANARGIYVSIMLFNGWSVVSRKTSATDKTNGMNPWRGHPFNRNNNINGIDGDRNGNGSGEESQALGDTALLRLQDKYVEKVVATVGDLDNVLYVVSNESEADSIDWQNHVIKVIRGIESSRPKQHPVGIGVAYPHGTNDVLFASGADWISPNGNVQRPMIADGTKVLVADTDHLCGVCGDFGATWKAFTSGENFLFMDPYNATATGTTDQTYVFNDPRWVLVRQSLQRIAQLARQLNLSHAAPHPRLCSSGYCLANLVGGEAFIVALSLDGDELTVDARNLHGHLSARWIHMTSGASRTLPAISAPGRITLKCPFPSGGVLVLSER